MIELSRRQFLAASGGLIVSFTLAPRLALAQAAKLPGSLDKEPMLDAWIRIGVDGAVSVFTGKAELGQGIKTAILQIAAEQLAVDMARIELITADTARTANEGYTAGSNSMKDSATAILHATAQARETLVGEAAKRFNVPASELTARNGMVHAKDGRSVGYGQLVSAELIHVRAEPQSKLATARTVMGKPIARVDIPAKVTGGVAYVQDLRLPDMVHARVVRPPRYGAQLKSLNEQAAGKMAGVLKIVRDGNYVAVIAGREYQAVQAMRALSDGAAWESGAQVPAQRDIYSYLQRLPSQDFVIAGKGDAALAGKVFEATYLRPYQIHGSIGPSCAVGLFKDDALTVWTHSQGVYPLRDSIAEMLGMPKERVRCIHMEGSGCYGHNGADDAGADAALLARAYPGRPVRVQWMREEEHAWEPFGPAMIGKVAASLDANGNVAGWRYDVWSNAHSTRPGGAGNLAPAWLLAKPFAQPAPKPIPQPEGGGDRNAIPLYTFPQPTVAHHFIPEMPLRVSALRALGAYLNVFAIESFVDELARTAKADPVEYRLRQLADPRARDVIQTAAEHFGWSSYKRSNGRGRGFGFARYKNLAGYAAIAMEVDVDRESGAVRVLRVVAAADSGEAVNPDGIRNQIEGGIIQSISWTLFEAVSFDGPRIKSRDWSSYPILRFSAVPERLEVHVIDRPGQPFLGTGEAAQGPAAGALANAVADATGVRIRGLPLSRARVKEAIGL
jgi:nicotinate dehydrogenase subunit B